MPTTIRTVLALAFSVLAATPLCSQGRSDVLKADEIAKFTGNSASLFDVVQALRPRWLQVHNTYLQGPLNDPVRSEGAHVYLNDHDQGDIEYLKTIRADVVAELRWMSPTEAGARFGPTNGPAIVIILKH